MKSQVMGGSEEVSKAMVFVSPRVRADDWDVLEDVTSGLRVMGASKVVAVLRENRNGRLSINLSPLSVIRREFNAAIVSVNAAFKRNNLPYRLRKEGEAAQRLLDQTVRIWRVR